MIKSIAHASFLVADVKLSLNFYCNILEISQNITRPDSSFDGAWLNLGISGQQLHLIQALNLNSRVEIPKHGGNDKHVALVVEDIDVLASHLESAGIEISRSKSKRRAFFCRDPDGNALEFIEDCAV